MPIHHRSSDIEVSKYQKLLEIIFKLGAPAAILGWVAYWLTTSATPVLAGIRDNISVHIIKSDEHYRTQDITNQLLQQLCINTAVNAGTDPAKCVK